MSTATLSPLKPEPQLAGQAVVVIGGSAGIGLETARLAHAEGASLVLTARNPERLQNVARELTTASTVAFDATDFERLAQFFEELPAPIDHLLLTGPGPYYASLADFDFEKARRTIGANLFLPLQVARHAANKVRPGGTLLFMGGTVGRGVSRDGPDSLPSRPTRPVAGVSLNSTTANLPTRRSTKPAFPAASPPKIAALFQPLRTLM